MGVDKAANGRRVEIAPTGTPIAFRLDPASGVPTYLQLVQQVEHALLLGYLKPGDQLPTVRGVVAELAINPNTVLKAYRELEHKGLASGRPGQGTFVQAGMSQATLPELTGLRRALVTWIADAEAAGLDATAVAAVFASTLRDFTERREARSPHGVSKAGRQAPGGAA